MITENSKKVELLYQQIQQLCLKNLAQTKYKKEDTKAYSNILNTCFDILKRATLHQNNQKEKDYQSSFFEDGYKLGYTLADYNTKQLDVLLYNSDAHFDTWQPNTNPYAQLQHQGCSKPNDTHQTVDTLTILRQIKRILKQEQDTQEIIKEIKFLLNST